MQTQYLHLLKRNCRENIVRGILILQLTAGQAAVFLVYLNYDSMSISNTYPNIKSITRRFYEALHYNFSLLHGDGSLPLWYKGKTFPYLLLNYFSLKDETFVLCILLFLASIFVVVCFCVRRKQTSQYQ
jgi:hypothetical protein